MNDIAIFFLNWFFIAWLIFSLCPEQGKSNVFILLLGITVIFFIKLRT